MAPGQGWLPTKARRREWSGLRRLWPHLTPRVPATLQARPGPSRELGGLHTRPPAAPHLHLQDGLLTQPDGLQLLLGDVRKQSLLLALPRAVTSAKDLLILSQLHEGRLGTLLVTDTGRCRSRALADPRPGPELLPTVPGPRRLPQPKTRGGCRQQASGSGLQTPDCSGKGPGRGQELKEVSTGSLPKPQPSQEGHIPGPDAELGDTVLNPRTQNIASSQLLGPSLCGPEKICPVHTDTKPTLLSGAMQPLQTQCPAAGQGHRRLKLTQIGTGRTPYKQGTNTTPGTPVEGPGGGASGGSSTCLYLYQGNLKFKKMVPFPSTKHTVAAGTT